MCKHNNSSVERIVSAGEAIHIVLQVIKSMGSLSYIYDIIIIQGHILSTYTLQNCVSNIFILLSTRFFGLQWNSRFYSNIEIINYAMLSAYTLYMYFSSSIQNKHLPYTVYWICTKYTYDIYTYLLYWSRAPSVHTRKNHSYL